MEISSDRRSATLFSREPACTSDRDRRIYVYEGDAHILDSTLMPGNWDFSRL